MRREAKHTIQTEGRDKGKTFLITEMSASQGESWAMRVILALMSSNVDIPENFQTLGMAGLAELGMKAIAGLRWDVAEPLLREMFDCIQIIVDPHKAAATTRQLEPAGTGDYDIEEIATRFELRRAFWELHMGFLMAVAPSLKGKLTGAAPAGKRSNIGA